MHETQIIPLEIGTLFLEIPQYSNDHKEVLTKLQKIQDKLSYAQKTSRLLDTRGIEIIKGKIVKRIAKALGYAVIFSYEREYETNILVMRYKKLDKEEKRNTLEDTILSLNSLINTFKEGAPSQKEDTTIYHACIQKAQICINIIQDLIRQTASNKEETRV